MRGSFPVVEVEHLGDGSLRIRCCLTRRDPEGGTGGGTIRAFTASLTCLSRVTMRFPRSRLVRDGRGWDRTSDLPRVKRALSR
jgi:hypothetical protein